MTTTAPPPQSTPLSATDLSSTLPPTSKSTHTLPPPFHNTTPAPELLTQGAEALVYKTSFLTPTTPAALKFRPSKPYRHPILDARLTKQRVLAEARVLVRLAGLKADGVVVPAVLSLEWDVSRRVKGSEAGAVKGGQGAWLLMEWVDGKSVKQLLRDWDVWYQTYGVGMGQDGRDAAERDVKRLLNRVGRAVAAMHNKGGVVHGDLTSSNIMVRPVGTRADDDDDDDVAKPPDVDGEIVLIDFGLAVQSVQEEDRAVDLYVLERAFGSTHPRQEAWFDQEVLQCQEGYRGVYKGANGILRRLEEVRMRGRKRTMIG